MLPTGVLCILLRAGQAQVQHLVGRVSLAGHATDVQAVLWHLASAQVVTADAEGQICVWKPSEGVIKHTCACLCVLAARSSG